MFIAWWMDKPTVLRPYYELLLSFKKELNSSTCSNVGTFLKYTKHEGQMYHNIIVFVWHSRKHELLWQRADKWLARVLMEKGIDLKEKKGFFRVLELLVEWLYNYITIYIAPIL